MKMKTSFPTRGGSKAATQSPPPPAPIKSGPPTLFVSSHLPP